MRVRRPRFSHRDLLRLDRWLYHLTIRPARPPSTHCSLYTRGLDFGEGARRERRSSKYRIAIVCWTDCSRKSSSHSKALPVVSIPSLRGPFHALDQDALQWVRQPTRHAERAAPTAQAPRCPACVAVTPVLSNPLAGVAAEAAGLRVAAPSLTLLFGTVTQLLFALSGCKQLLGLARIV